MRSTGSSPPHLAPEQLARDAEDYAFHVLSEVAESDPDNPLVVYSDCKGSIGCASNVGVGLDLNNPRRHFWEQWWTGVGKDASVHKVRAHVSLESAADDHEEWCIRGNRLADLWAKKGAKLWAVPPQQVLFIEGVETLALAASRWHARAQQSFGALSFRTRRVSLGRRISSWI